MEKFNYNILGEEVIGAFQGKEELMKLLIDRLIYLDLLKVDFSSPNITYPVKGGYRQEYITDTRKKIHDECLVNMKERTNITQEDLLFLANLYKLYFKIEISHTQIKLGNRCKKAVSRCKYDYDKRENTISISLHIINNYPIPEKGVEVCGIIVSDSISIVQILLEHELCHSIVFLNSPQENNINLEQKHIYKPHGEYFKMLSNAFFKHANTKHGLFFIEENNNPSYQNMSVGDKITFEFCNKETEGKIVKFNKKTVRAILETEDEVLVPYELIKSWEQELLSCSL